ncbi:unnamed protein product [Orchesella dallaii]|uniref:C-type lectin domain-containing protein n=1 Tax=Orchesella dallaii TaxID=48710 RepID=A0ABP1QXN6_9HEXA
MHLRRGNVRIGLANFFCWLWWVEGIYASEALIDLAQYKNLTDHDKSDPAAPVLKDPGIELLKLEGTRFSILRKRVTWPEAVTECQSRATRLVSLPLMEDAKSLIDAIKNNSQPFFDGYEDEVMKYEFGMDRRYWIGLTDMVIEGEWEWITEGYALRYSNMWYIGQPDHTRNSTSEHCCVLWNPGYEYGDTHTFNDEDCSNKHYAVCGEEPPLFQNLMRKRDPAGKLSTQKSLTNATHPESHDLPPCSAESDENTDKSNLESVECDESKPTRKPRRKHAHRKIRKGRKVEKNEFGNSSTAAQIVSFDAL